MPFLLADVYEVMANEQSGFGIEPLIIGSEERTQGGVLWGVDNGRVREGSGARNCLTPEQAEFYRNVIEGEGESFLFGSSRALGTKGSIPDPVASTFSVSGAAPPSGLSGTNYAAVLAGDLLRYDLSHLDLANREWHISLWEYISAWRHTAVRFDGTAIQAAHFNGGATSAANVTAAQGWMDLNSSNELTLYGTDDTAGLFNRRFGLMSVRPYVPPDVTLLEDIYDVESIRPPAGLPFMNVTGSLLDDEVIKARMHVKREGRQSFFNPDTGALVEAGVSLEFVLREVEPS